MLGEKLGVAIALAQRRQHDREHGEPIHQVFAQTTVTNGIERVAIGRREHADVGPDLAIAADANETAGLEHAQQPHLHLERHFGDFVEEQRAAFGALEVAAMLPVGAGERARSWPNSSASIRFCGIAPQLIATNGRVRAGCARESCGRRAPCRSPIRR